MLLCCTKNKKEQTVRPRVKGRNIVAQQLPTSLDVTCCDRFHTVLHVVASCYGKFEFLSQELPTFLLFPIAEALRNNVGSVQQHKCLKRLMGCIFPTMNNRSQHYWELLHPFAYHCQRNNSQHCWRNW